MRGDIVHCLVFVLLSTVPPLLTACDQGQTPVGQKNPGVEGGPCKANSVCDPGLTCSAGICVKAKDGGGAIKDSTPADLSPTPDMKPTPDMEPKTDLKPAPDMKTAPDMKPTPDLKPAPDMTLKPDQFTGTSRQVTFMENSGGAWTKGYGVYHVQSNGSGLKKLLPSGAGLYDLSGVKPPNWPVGYRVLDGNLPHWAYYIQHHTPLALGQGRGHVRQVTNTATYKNSILLSRFNGEVEELFQWATTSMKWINSSHDGRLLATQNKALNGYSLVLLRTDKATFKGGKKVLELPYSVFGSINKILNIDQEEAAFAGSHFISPIRPASLYPVEHLVRLPVDGSAGLSLVTPPKVGGASISNVLDHARCPANTIYTFRGSTGPKDQLFSVTGGGKPVLLAQSASMFVPYSMSTFWWISPKGTQVAYLGAASKSASRRDLYVVDTGGAGTPVKVTGSVAGSVGTYIMNLRFVDEQRLLVQLGAWSGKSDWFRFDIKTGLLTNLTATGDTSKPYTLNGTLHCAPGWLSPDRKRVLCAGGPSNFTITSYEVSSGTKKELTTGLTVPTKTSRWRTCGSKLLFDALPKGSSAAGGELFMIDMNTAAPAVQMTTLNKVSMYSSKDHVFQAAFSGDCKQAAFIAGRTARYHLYHLNLASPKTEVNITGPITSSGQHVGDNMRFSGDGSHLAFVGGVNNQTSSVQVVKTSTPGKPSKVHTPTAGSKHRLMLLGIQ